MKPRWNKHRVKRVNRFVLFLVVVSQLFSLAVVILLTGAASDAMPRLHSRFEDWIRGLDSFAMKGFEFVGSRFVDEETIAKLLEENSGMSLFDLSTERIEKSLMATGLFVQVSVERDWPSRLHVSVVEKEPIALRMIDGRMKAIDGEGEPVPYAYRILPDRPVLKVKGGDVPLAGLALLNFLEREDCEMVSRISEVIENKEEIKLVMRRPVCIVDLGADWDERKISALRYTLVEMERLGKYPKRIHLTEAASAIVRIVENGG